jgi:uncharacterized damage-inducible protein DinB
MWHDHFLHLATYGQWANARLFDAASHLPEADYRADRGAFFRSIHGTLNHLLMADLLWIGRIAPPAFVTTGYDMIVEDDRDALRRRREAVDRRIIDTIEDLPEAAFIEPLSWISMEREPKSARLDKVLTHLFNHQTHHRGQVHNMLSQTGHSPPTIDFFWVMFDPPTS